MHRAGSRLVLFTLLLAMAGCGANGAASSASPEEPGPTPTVRIPIGPDGPELPEGVVADLQAYGAQHRDEFAGLYVDDQSRGSFVMLFTDRLEEHAAAIAEIWPRVSVRGARFSEAELTAVLERLDLAGMAAEGIEPLSAGLDTMNNRVTLDVKSDDPTLEARLELRYGGMVDVTVYPLPGEWSNVAEGAGWRLLAAGEAGGDEAYTVRAATDARSWDALWSALALDEERPDVALADEVVVSFAHGIGSSCREVRLDDVVVEGGVVFSLTSDPLAPRGCTSDLAGAAVFVVAVERAALPSDGFTLQLSGRSVTCPDCGFTEQIDVPLP
jgi:hypothetical protein